MSGTEGVRVPSFTTDDVYEVVKYDGVLVCDCPSFGFGGKRWCKHAELVSHADLMMKRCEERHGTVGSICRTCFVAVLVAAVRKVKSREKKPRKKKSDDAKQCQSCGLFGRHKRGCSRPGEFD